MFTCAFYLEISSIFCKSFLFLFSFYFFCLLIYLSNHLFNLCLKLFLAYFRLIFPFSLCLLFIYILLVYLCMYFCIYLHSCLIIYLILNYTTHPPRVTKKIKHASRTLHRTGLRLNLPVSREQVMLRECQKLVYTHVLYCIDGVVITAQCTATFLRSFVLPVFGY